MHHYLNDSYGRLTCHCQHTGQVPLSRDDSRVHHLGHGGQQHWHARAHCRRQRHLRRPTHAAHQVPLHCRHARHEVPNQSLFLGDSGTCAARDVQADGNTAASRRKQHTLCTQHHQVQCMSEQESRRSTNGGPGVWRRQPSNRATLTCMDMLQPTRNGRAATAADAWTPPNQKCNFKNQHAQGFWEPGVRHAFCT